MTGPLRDDPRLAAAELGACLSANYGIEARAITFLPLGYDFNAAVYEVVADDGMAYFLKTRNGPPNEPSLEVPRALLERGVPHILAPLRTRTASLWCPFGGRSVVLYPYLRGENAMVAGMTPRQWRTFGDTLRAVHDSGLTEAFRGRLPEETFALPAAAVVRDVQASLTGARFASPAVADFATFWREKAGEIAALLARAEALGRQLQRRSFPRVLCHADIHAANILVGDDGQITLIDWDWPIIAPPERDLFFVIGSKIAREVTPREEALFLAGYGLVEFDSDALIYYRYERIIEDIGDFGKSVFFDASLSEPMREEAETLVRGFFAPGGMLDTVAVIR